MRYYPDETIQLKDMKRKLQEFSCNERSDKILLTQYGMFKYVNDVLMVSKFNLREEGNMSIKKYINMTCSVTILGFHLSLSLTSLETQLSIIST